MNACGRSYCPGRISQTRCGVTLPPRSMCRRSSRVSEAGRYVWDMALQPEQKNSMATSFLYERITERRPKSTGTLAEPNGAPEPRFALQGTVSWMRALALLVADQRIDWTSMQTFYRSNVQRNMTLSEPAINTIFEQLLMSLHHLSALQAMVRADSDRDLARVAVMAFTTWFTPASPCTICPRSRRRSFSAVSRRGWRRTAYCC
jgi:hypothetical protein